MNNKLFSEKTVMIAIGFLAFCCYLLFNLAVPFDYFNHDLGGLNAHHGHMGYMWHIWENWTLPVFSIDPVTQESYYNPPLHYILGALWIKATLLFSDSLKTGFESLQILTSLYMAGVLFFFYKILFLLKIKHKILCWVYIAFNPMMFILSSLINNDGLLFLTAVGTFYYGLLWYQHPSFHSAIKAALFMGLGLMTKCSGILIIPLLALIFAFRFFKDKHQRKLYLLQLLVYLLIMLPIGGWYYGYALIKHHTPINYVQGWKDPDSDIGERHTLYDRFTHDEWGNFYVNLEKDKNWNMWSLGIKTSLFDEHNYRKSPLLNLISGVLFYTSTLFFFIICFYSFGYFLYRPLGEIKMPDIILVLYIVLLLLSYIYFNYQFPHPWTANFRYLPSFFICAICLWDKFLKDKTILFYLPALIGATSAGFYLVLTYQHLCQ